MVLKRRPSEDDFVFEFELVKVPQNLRALVFDAMPFVEDQVLPSDHREKGSLLDNGLVGGQEDIKFKRFGTLLFVVIEIKLIVDNNLAVRSVPME